MQMYFKKDKYRVFIVFTVLALFTSIVGKLTSVYERDIVFKINLVDVPEDKIVYNKSSDSVLLKVRGYGFNLAKFYLSNPEFKISVKKLKEINNTFIWNQEQNFNDIKLDFDPSVELLTIYEDSILFYFDQYVSENKKIIPNVSLNYLSGFDSFNLPQLSIDSVSILGPKDIIGSINYVDTESIKLNNVSSDVKMNLSLIKPGFENISLESSIVEYKLEVDRYTEETIAIPVNVLSNSEIKFNYFPKEITVKYFISIDDYKKTSSVDFRVDCIFDKNKKICTII